MYDGKLKNFNLSTFLIDKRCFCIKGGQGGEKEENVYVAYAFYLHMLYNIYLHPP